MRKLVLITMILSLVFSLSAFAGDCKGDETCIKFKAQVRHRFQAANTDFCKDTDYAYINLLRTRLGMVVHTSNGVEAFIQLQDSRIMGEETSTLTDGTADAMDLHQGYFKVKDFADLPVDVKIGRMEVAYGPQRLIGSVGWHNIGRSFDGFIFTVKVDKAKIDLFNLKQVEAGADSDDGDMNVYGAYADLKLIEKHKTQAFFIYQSRAQTDVPADSTNDLARFTAGVYAKGSFSGFHHETEFAYQGGTVTPFGVPANEKDVSAMMFALNVGYSPPDVSFKPDVTVGVDYLSGDDDPADDTHKAFDTMYATNHKYYGYMDYFMNIPATFALKGTNGLGLMDMHVKLSAKPRPKGLIRLAFHMFNTVEDYTSTVDQSTMTALGNEVDLTMKRKYNNNVTFVGGASMFMPGDIFKEVKGEDNSTFFFLQSIFNL